MFCVVYSSIRKFTIINNQNYYRDHDNGVIITIICLSKKSHSSNININLQAPVMVRSEYLVAASIFLISAPAINQVNMVI